MSYLDRVGGGRKNDMPLRSALFSGGIAVAVAIALITSPSESDSPPSALATTEATTEVVVESTTTAPSSTTSTTTLNADDDVEAEPRNDVLPVWVGPGSGEASGSAENPSLAEGSSAADDVVTANPSPSVPTAAAPASGPPPVSISRPACANNVGSSTTRTAPFTGVSASIPSNMPAVVVKVSNNSAASRSALIGLDQADIVFEERIEASATRFFAVFHSERPANVGPVRSGRTTDIQLTQNLNNPVFGYSGSNDGVARQIRFAADNGILTPFVNTDRAPFARDSRYRAPDNLFVDPAALGGCGGGGNPTAVFSYGANNSTTAQAANSVSLSARSSYRFDWNGSAWVRSQSGTTHTTRTGELLDPENVVVLFVPYVQSQIDAASVDAVTIGSGQAWLFRDGTATIGSWSRERGGFGYTITDGNGNATNLAPGQTWVVLAPAGSASWE